MRYKAILAELARKRYPLSILLMVIGVLVIPFPYLFIHFGLELTDSWWSLLGICSGIVTGSMIVGFGSLVEDIHDISMHTVGYDLEVGDIEEGELDEGALEPEDREEATDEAEQPVADDGTKPAQD